MSIYSQITPIQFALEIREFAADSCWVYRHDMGQDGTLKPTPRIVFFTQTREKAMEWIDAQRRSQEGCVVLAN